MGGSAAAEAAAPVRAKRNCVRVNVIIQDTNARIIPFPRDITPREDSNRTAPPTAPSTAIPGSPPGAKINPYSVWGRRTSLSRCVRIEGGLAISRNQVQ